MVGPFKTSSKLMPNFDGSSKEINVHPITFQSRKGNIHEMFHRILDTVFDWNSKRSMLTLNYYEQFKKGFLMENSRTVPIQSSSLRNVYCVQGIG